MKKDISSILADADVSLGPKTEAKLAKAMDAVMQAQMQEFKSKTQAIVSDHETGLDSWTQARADEIATTSSETLRALRTSLTVTRETELNVSKIYDAVQDHSSNVENRMRQIGRELDEIGTQIHQMNKTKPNWFKWSAKKAFVGMGILIGTLLTAMTILIFLTGKTAWHQSQIRTLTDQVDRLTAQRDRTLAQANAFRTTYGMTFNFEGPQGPTITLAPGQTFGRVADVGQNNTTHNDWRIE